MGVGVLLATWALRDQLATLFTQDEETVEALRPLIMIVAIVCIAEGFIFTQALTIRALNLQMAGLAINVFAFFAVGLSLQLWLCFGSPEMGLNGLWYGYLSGLFVSAIMQQVLLELTDWHHQVSQTQA